MSSLIEALPTSYRSNPVIPYPPNGPDDRGHVWDWAGRVEANPAGLTAASVDATYGTESWPIRYAGLTRADARAIETFVEDRVGRKEGFWCPTFQQDFYVWHGNGDQLYIREWGYVAKIQPLGNAFRYFAAHKYQSGGTSNWCLSHWQGSFSSGGTDDYGFPLQIYTAARDNEAGDPLAWTATNGTRDGVAVMRMMFCRFADDAIRTAWDHPNCANLELRVVTVPNETPT